MLIINFQLITVHCLIKTKQLDVFFIYRDLPNFGLKNKGKKGNIYRNFDNKRMHDCFPDLQHSRNISFSSLGKYFLYLKQTVDYLKMNCLEMTVLTFFFNYYFFLVA